MSKKTMGKRNRRRRNGGAKTTQGNMADHGQYSGLPLLHSHHCHRGPTMVFTTGDAIVWGGSWAEVNKAPLKWDLLICCAGHQMVPTNTAIISSAGVPELARGHATTPWVALDWADGEIPNRIPGSYWRDLARALTSGEIAGNVGIYCVGGHGRTGTALAVLATLCGAVPEDEDPVVWLRERYCEEAVETDEQCQFVADITGRDVELDGSFMHLWRQYVAERDALRSSRQELSTMYQEERGEPVFNAAGDVVAYTGD